MPHRETAACRNGISMPKTNAASVPINEAMRIAKKNRERHARMEFMRVE